MGLALAWPDMAHRRLHEQRDYDQGHSGHHDTAPVSSPIVGYETHHDDHPHLDLIAAVPTKAAPYVAVLLSQNPDAADVPAVVVRVSLGVNVSIRPRGPPPGPPPPTRAPPTA
jgi:hypothetical protein